MTKIITGLLLGSALTLVAVSVWPPTAVSQTDTSEYDLARPINDVAPADFYAEYQANPEAFDFIDVRGESAYTAAHAEGSRNLPLHNLYTEKDVLPKEGKTIVLICSGGVASGVGYHYLEHHGFDNVIRIEDGIEAWVDAGLPTVYE